MKKLSYTGNCGTWPKAKMPELEELLDNACQITRRTFLKWVDGEDRRDLEQELGYAPHPRAGLTMAKDYHVTYWKSSVAGKPAYFFVWSATEYVFGGE